MPAIDSKQVAKNINNNMDFSMMTSKSHSEIDLFIEETVNALTPLSKEFINLAYRKLLKDSEKSDKE